jgi:hypothetical protein
MDWTELIAVVQNIGIPGFLVVGGGIWFARSAFPAMIEVIKVYADAMCKNAEALEAVAKVLGNQEPRTLD